MGLEIVEICGNGNACFYCNTSEHVFGPLLYSVDVGEKFMDKMKSRNISIRSMPLHELETEYSIFELEFLKTI